MIIIIMEFCINEINADDSAQQEGNLSICDETTRLRCVCVLTKKEREMATSIHSTNHI